MVLPQLSSRIFISFSIIRHSAGLLDMPAISSRKHCTSGPGWTRHDKQMADQLGLWSRWIGTFEWSSGSKKSDFRGFGVASGGGSGGGGRRGLKQFTLSMKCLRQSHFSIVVRPFEKANSAWPVDGQSTHRRGIFNCCICVPDQWVITHCGLAFSAGTSLFTLRIQRNCSHICRGYFYSLKCFQPEMTVSEKAEEVWRKYCDSALGNEWKEAVRGRSWGHFVLPKSDGRERDERRLSRAIFHANYNPFYCQRVFRFVQSRRLWELGK